MASGAARVMSRPSKTTRPVLGRTSPEIVRLREVGQLLGMFWGRPEVTVNRIGESGHQVIG